MFKSSIYKDRRDELRNVIRKGIILFLGNTNSPINYPSNCYKFRQDSNFLYYFGIDKPGLAAVMDLDNGLDILYGDDLEIEDVIWEGEQPTLAELGALVEVKNVSPLKNLQKDIAKTIKKGVPVHFLPPYRAEHLLTLSEILGVLPNKKVIENYVSHELRLAVIAQRSIKQECEINELDRVAEVGYAMQVTAMRMASPGVEEHEMAGVLEGIAHSYGYMTSFATILSQNGETLHNEKHSQTLSDGRLLLVDCGAESELHYASDHTRVTPVNGRFTPEQLAVYNTVLAAHDIAIEKAKPGIPYRDIHLEACRKITEGLQEMGLMKGNIDESVANGAHALFMPHGLGHMMGVDTHDMEGLDQKYVGFDEEIKASEQFGLSALRFGRRLQKNYVVTVEPGIYFIPALIANWKNSNTNAAFINFDRLESFLTFGGIRLEDDIVITDTGCRILGEKQIPIKPDDVIAAYNS
ncbi:MAG: aminopeptidase P family protein [Bacteroides sp.]